MLTSWPAGFATPFNVAVFSATSDAELVVTTGVSVNSYAPMSGGLVRVTPRISDGREEIYAPAFGMAVAVGSKFDEDV